jgi:hypothetical protein
MKMYSVITAFLVCAAVNIAGASDSLEISMCSCQYSDLETRVRNNIKQNLGKTFEEGQVMVNLVHPTVPGVDVVKNDQGEFYTKYIVPKGSTITVMQRFQNLQICVPSFASTEPCLTKRLDGQGLGKETSDGSICIGRLNFNSFQPVEGKDSMSVRCLSMSEELRVDIGQRQRQRRTKGLQDKEFKPRPQTVSHKPSPEDLAAIKREKLERCKTKLDTLRKQYDEIDFDLLQGNQEAKAKVPSVKKGFELLEKNVADEDIFQRLYANVNGKIEDLRAISNKARQASAASQVVTYSIPFATLQDIRDVGRETKAQAEEKLSSADEKATSRLNRPNAAPAPKAAEEQKSEPEKPKKPAQLYIFLQPCAHDIIHELEETSNEDSSYAGITISRERLSNFVMFLHAAERAQQTQAGKVLDDKDDLGYYYREDQGKGSHTKVKLGRGTKPIIMSREGGINLSVNQLRDLKNVLFQKGLMSHELTHLGKSAPNLSKLSTKPVDNFVD